MPLPVGVVAVHRSTLVYCWWFFSVGAVLGQGQLGSRRHLSRRLGLLRDPAGHRDSRTTISTSSIRASPSSATNPDPDWVVKETRSSTRPSAGCRAGIADGRQRNSSPRHCFIAASMDNGGRRTAAEAGRSADQTPTGCVAGSRQRRCRFGAWTIAVTPKLVTVDARPRAGAFAIDPGDSVTPRSRSPAGRTAPAGLDRLCLLRLRRPRRDPQRRGRRPAALPRLGEFLLRHQLAILGQDRRAR